MNEILKKRYLPPGAQLISFLPRTLIPAQLGEMTEDNAFTYFESDDVTRDIVSGEVVDPGGDLG